MAFVDPLRYPANIPGLIPDLAYGCIRLTPEAGGAFSCIATDLAGTNPRDITMAGTPEPDDIFDPAALGVVMTASSPNAAQVTRIYNQKGNLFFNAGATFADGPRIWTDTWNGIRPFLFEGGSDTDGLMDWMAADVLSLGVKANRHSVVMVVKPTTSLARNVRNNLSPTINTFFEFSAGGGTVQSTLFSDGSMTPPNGGRPCWRAVSGATVGGGFDFKADDLPVEVNPTVVWYVKDKNGVRVRANGVMRKMTTGIVQSNDVANTFWLGRKQSSQNPPVTPPYVPMNEAMDGWLFAMMIWNDRALTENECNTIDRSFNLRFAPYFGEQIGKLYNYKTVNVLGDSITAEFGSDNTNPGTYGLWGWLTRVQQGMTFPARFYNWAVAGSPMTTNGPFTYAYADGYFDQFVLPMARYSPRGNLLVIWHGGNDAYINPQPTAATVYASITAACNKWLARGGLKPIVMTVMDRNDNGSAPGGGDPQTHRNALNALIRAGSSSIHTVADVQALSSNLQRPNIPNTYLPDGTHMSGTPGGALVAGFMRPLIEAALGSAK